MSDRASAKQPDRQRGVRIPIWLKMATALVVPLVAVAGLCLVQINNARDRVAEVDHETSLAGVALAPGGLLDALIVERGDATVTILGIRGTSAMPTKNFADSVSETDIAIKKLQAGVDKGGPEAEAAFGPALMDLSRSLSTVRKTVNDGSKDAGLANWDSSQQLYAGYSDVIDQLTSANDNLSAAISDPSLRRAAVALGDVNQLQDALSNLSRGVGTALGPSDGTSAARDNVVAAHAAFVDAREDLASRTSGPWADEARAFGRNTAYLKMATQAQDWLETNKIDLTAYVGLSPGVKRGVAAPIGTAQAVAQKATKTLQADIDAKRQAARDQQTRYIILSLVVMLGATIIAALIARSVTRPMRSLTEQAERMASDSLPGAVKSVQETPPGQDVVVPTIPPVKVNSRDELQTVAASLNHVQQSALDLAVEQATLRRNIADSFVSLGRRTQNLIGLQLELITDLETDETDPAALDSLYRLDHLATRARRNAESLVVLGGIETTRAGGAPVPMSDVIRATLSEVEAYQRVEITDISAAMVPTNTAADLIHLLAELVENGLSFSPPNQSVEVEGRRADDGYTITVTDHGVGMTPDRLEQANRRLADNETFTVAPSRYLGHYVAGKLARRVGASIKLTAGSGSGVVATVTVPTSLLTEATARPENAPSEERVPRPGRNRDGAIAEPVEDHSPEPELVGAGVASTNGNTAAHMDGPEEHHEVKVDGRAPLVEDAPIEVTTGGLRKRVPGQHAKVTDRSPVLKSSGAHAANAAQAVKGETSPDQTENLASLLNAYTSGVERGRGDTDQANDDGSNPTEPVV